VLSSAPIWFFGYNFQHKILIDSELVFYKGNLIPYNLSRNRGDQISMFSRQKMQFNLLLKIVIFFETFFEGKSY